ncbi:bifunctional riboflavin kinase/FAD synthetase [Alkaliphilus transvaalensis]|uniref:bifunctional riboflavin kinase/FAD synthetase n=1 Tax=Alkaliphilus transvaalensis TaxID=114628 RepID=UPI00047D2D49|nr:bifunctional riboflavin kinase/FAD synthetase [Alkaliphilus transvaalensis]
MIIVNEVKQLDIKVPRGVALGNFDGLHIGHQELIHMLLNKSKELELESCVYTFKNHTNSLIKHRELPPQITHQNVKIELFKALEIDSLVLAEFNEAIMGLSPEEFVKNILVDSLNCKFAVVGFDYRFGKKAQGDAVALVEFGKKYGFSVAVIDPVTLDDEKVSSTNVRKYISEGNMEKAKAFLGRPFSITSKVIHGMGRGKHLGYPTANILVESHQLIPLDGVYATLVTINNESYMGATCIGTNPTFDGKSISVETFILDYEGSLYDQFIEVQFMKRLRDNIRFDGIDALIDQMMKDVEIAKTYLQPFHNMIR